MFVEHCQIVQTNMIVEFCPTLTGWVGRMVATGGHSPPSFFIPLNQYTYSASQEAANVYCVTKTALPILYQPQALALQ